LCHCTVNTFLFKQFVVAESKRAQAGMYGKVMERCGATETALDVLSLQFMLFCFLLCSELCLRIYVFSGSVIDSFGAAPEHY
jgi:hypothetical protein